MKYVIPGQGNLEIDTIILDLNGTLVVRGKLAKGTEANIAKLIRKGMKFVMFSGDTRGNAQKIGDKLGIEVIKTTNSAEKLAEARKFNLCKTAAIGNGLIDLLKLKHVRLGIVTLQGEGVHVKSLLASDVIVPNINDALRLFLDENSLIATLRT